MNNVKPSPRKGTILVADDTAAMRLAVRKALEDDYDIIEAENGLQVLKLVAQHPELSCLIMDLTMPLLDGFKTTYILKANFTTYHLPIIILTSQIALEDMIAAVQMGADDYIKKPFDPSELKARVVMNLRRAVRDQNSNPLTKLPGNSIINSTILNRINAPVAIGYADLDNFKAYNDKYGFDMGDKVLLYTAKVLSHAVKTCGNPTDFLGNVGGDDFIFISTPDKADIVAQKICQDFDQNIEEFYNNEDRQRKKIIAYDRQGTLREYPLVSISVAVVTNEKRELTSTPQIAQIAAEIKHYAKSKPGGKLGSNYVKDRRAQ
jgi:diguanylate cyclase (GGDEF)-like protein